LISNFFYIGASQPPKVTIFQIEYYQKFFNIDTSEVVERIYKSVVPRKVTSTYLKTHLGVNPDLYGPFWITATLIFAIGISGNIANFFQHDHNSDFKWHYNFHLISFAATCIIMYVCLMPAIIWGVLKSTVVIDQDIDTDIEAVSVTFMRILCTDDKFDFYFQAPYLPSLLTLVCLYGYSLSAYVPVTILWTIQVSFIQWTLVITAALVSGTALINALLPSLKLSKFNVFLVIGISTMHFLLAAGFMLKFFHVPSVTSAVVQHAASGNHST
jgi:protein YIPF1/2